MNRDDSMTEAHNDGSEPGRLFNWNFTLLWQGQTISFLGTHLFSIAMILWIKAATGSASMVGLLAMVSSLPGIILGPVGGTFADRHSRKKIIIVTDTIRGLSITILAALLLAMPDRTGLILGCLFVVAVLGPVNNAFFAPAITAAIPDLVPRSKLTGANGVMRASMQVSQFVGQALGGVLFTVLGAPILFLFNGVSFLFSAISELFISIPQKLPSRRRRGSGGARIRLIEVEGGPFSLALPVDTGSGMSERLGPFVRDVIEGLRYVWRRPGMRALILGGGALAFFAAPIVVLLPFFVEDVLAAGSEWYGYYLAVFSVGTLIGSIVAGIANATGHSRRNLLIAALFVEAAAYLALGFVRTTGSAMFVAALSGTMTGFVGIHIATIVQATTPSEIRGRAVSLMATLSGSLVPVAMGLAGVVADLTGQNIPAVYVACGVAMLAVSVLLAANPSLRELVAHESDTPISAIQTPAP